MVIEFHLDTRSGVAPYGQLIHQVRQVLRSTQRASRRLALLALALALTGSSFWMGEGRWYRRGPSWR